MLPIRTRSYRRLMSPTGRNRVSPGASAWSRRAQMIGHRAPSRGHGRHRRGNHAHQRCGRNPVGKEADPYRSEDPPLTHRGPEGDVNRSPASRIAAFQIARNDFCVAARDRVRQTYMRIHNAAEHTRSYDNRRLTSPQKGRNFALLYADAWSPRARMTGYRAQSQGHGRHRRVSHAHQRRGGNPVGEKADPH